jgi:hypothetical protein
MTNFADQLFADLMREHGSTLAHTGPPAPKPRVAARRTLLAAGAGCLAVAGTAGALVAGGGGGGGGGGPAYAVTKNLNGTLTLDVYQTSGIAQANAKLHQLGDNVVIVPVGAGCPSIRSLPAPAVPVPLGGISVQGSRSKDGSITVNAQGIPAGDILVVAVGTSTNGTTTTSFSDGKLTSPPAPSCVSLPFAPPPPGNGG